MGNNRILTVKELGKFIRLDKETGDLFWLQRDRITTLNLIGKISANRVDSFNRASAGTKIPLSTNSWGYRIFSLGRQYAAHRVVFALHNGKWPNHQVDHINGIRDDNRPENLRDVVNWQNSRNQKKRSDNKSGYAGVRWENSRKAWVAEIRVDGKRISLGLHRTREIAYAIRKAAASAYGFDENHGTRVGVSHKAEYAKSQKMSPPKKDDPSQVIVNK